jgi:hypothetical protein
MTIWAEGAALSMRIIRFIILSFAERTPNAIRSWITTSIRHGGIKSLKKTTAKIISKVIIILSLLKTNFVNFIHTDKEYEPECCAT